MMGATSRSGMTARTPDKPFSTVGGGLKRKDLSLISARLAIALCDDGWWLRADNIWVKPNPKPESIKDRPTQAHEHVFLFTKAERYYYDARCRAASRMSRRPPGAGTSMEGRPCAGRRRSGRAAISKPAPIRRSAIFTQMGGISGTFG